MRVLHVTPSFYPATYFGGPIHSTYALCNALAKLPNIKLRVLTTDTAGRRRRERIAVNDFPTRLNGTLSNDRASDAGYDVYYCGRLFGVDFSPGLLVRLWTMIRWANVVHLTAVYSSPTIPTLLVCKLLNKPLVWSPRGSLQRWQGSSRTRTKRVWETICYWLCDKSRVTLHATSAEELRLSLLRIKRAEAVMIPNGVDLPATVGKAEPETANSLRLLYIGRLDKIKGIENLFAAMQLCEPSVTLAVCGDSANGYAGSLRALTDKLELSDRVRFEGHIAPEARARYLAESDVLVMPSFGESFGMVVAEALAHGIPVIASKGTPWSEIETVGCGLWVENDPKSLSAAITRISKMPRREMGAKGREWMAREFNWSAIAERMLALYKDLCKARL